MAISFVLAGIVFMWQTAHAQSNNLTPAQRAQLEQELAQVEAEQKQAEADLTSAQNESASLSRDIKVLDAKIKAAQLDIKAKTLLIQSLGNDISIKQGHINDLENSIQKGKETLSQILRKTNELDQYSLPEVILSQSTVAGFFQDLDSFQSVQQGLKDTMDQLRADEASTTVEKQTLTTRQNSEIDARYTIQQEQKNIQADESQKTELLAISKGNETSYTKLIAEKSAKAAQIRAALFSLRDAAAIPFGDAYKYAQLVSQKTGVKPAFLLAIMTQESNLGKNVGSCYLTNTLTGDGVNADTGALIASVMNPKRDVPPFLQILQAIGGDYSKQVVSCPQSIGWGGAMGPAQFIASTWMLFKDRVAAALGINGMPDPWNPVHAFMASAMYLSDLGASAQTYTAERNAACKYYSGRPCGAIRGNAAYGNSVIVLADNIQRDMIDPLQGI